ncbi:MAG: hypothetical protein WBH35_08240 [Bacillota bacterium]|jgi:hypothetical protein|nr:hypothetical protein [Bacillota bacterium]HOB90541.1 hypothetical protein [Bacillota bacterium]HPZ53613.1 hypothetical protein [Bacillota bacterium]HQD17174.1 hypothetical protein [Bacillota bacterium]
MPFGLLRRIADWISGSASQKEPKVGANEVPVYLRCGICGKAVMLRLRKTSEIQRNYDRENHPNCEYYVQKVVADGNSRCPNRMNVVIEFDERYRIVRQKIIEGRFSKGEFITAEEYAESVKASAAEDAGQ